MRQHAMVLHCKGRGRVEDGVSLSNCNLNKNYKVDSFYGIILTCQIYNLH
jgi:hypothetical protein